MPPTEYQEISRKMDAMLDVIKDIAVDIGKLQSSKEETDKLCHETRIGNLERWVATWSGGKVMLLWMMTTGISFLAMVAAVIALFQKR